MSENDKGLKNGCGVRYDIIINIWYHIWYDIYHKATDKGIYFCDADFTFMNDNIIPRHIRFLGILYKQTLKNVYHHILFENTSHNI